VFFFFCVFFPFFSFFSVVFFFFLSSFLFLFSRVTYGALFPRSPWPYGNFFPNDSGRSGFAFSTFCIDMIDGLSSRLLDSGNRTVRAVGCWLQGGWDWFFLDGVAFS